MNLCGKPVELGGVASFPCVIKTNHDGPCMSHESEVSKVRRERWNKAQDAIVKEASAPVAPVAPVAAHAPDTAANVPKLTTAMVAVSAPGERERGMMKRLSETSPEDLPPAVKSWMMGALATTTLMTIWQLAHSEFDKSGSSVVVMTKEFLESVVPESLKVVFAQYQLGAASSGSNSA